MIDAAMQRGIRKQRLFNRSNSSNLDSTKQ